MRTVRDEAFFDLQALRRRIMPIGMASVACTYCTVWFLGLCTYRYATYKIHLYLCVCELAARRFGIYDVPDEYLLLLSHGIQVCPIYTLDIKTPLMTVVCVYVCVCAGEVKRYHRESYCRQPTQNRVSQGWQNIHIYVLAWVCNFCPNAQPDSQ